MRPRRQRRGLMGATTDRAEPLSDAVESALESMDAYPNETTGPDEGYAAALERSVGELTALYDVSRRLGSTRDAGEVLETLLDSALVLLRSSRGYVVLSEPDGTLFLRSVRGVEYQRVAGRRFSVAEHVLAHERPLVLNPAEIEGPVDPITGMDATLAVPIPSVQRAIGVLVVADGSSDRRFSSDDVRLLSTVANQAGMAVANAELYSHLQDAYLATVRSLAAAIDAKDPYTRGHSDRVASFASLVGERLAFSSEERLALELSAYLHDIGKIGIREGVLHKPGHLDDREAAEMRSHPLIGATILSPVEFPWAITPNVRHHHEHWDGSGYPDGLAGEQIPLIARIISVADSHEAMISDRPYRKGRSIEEAITELQRCAGTQFDASIVGHFCAALAEDSSGVHEPDASRGEA